MKTTTPGPVDVSPLCAWIIFLSQYQGLALIRPKAGPQFLFSVELLSGVRPEYFAGAFPAHFGIGIRAQRYTQRRGCRGSREALLSPPDTHRLNCSTAATSVSVLTNGMSGLRLLRALWRSCFLYVFLPADALLCVNYLWVYVAGPYS